MRAAALAPQEARLLMQSVRSFVRAERPGEESVHTPSHDRVDSATVDWDHLIELAEQHGTTALLHRHIEATRRTEAPTAARAMLRARYIERVGRNLHMASELLDLLDALNARGIRAVPYKGPAMTADLYGNVALRDFRNLDLFIDKSDVLRAKAVLVARGFEPDERMTETSERTLLNHGCEYAFHHTQGVHVEVHWALMHGDHGFPVASGCWERLSTTQLCGTEVPSFSPEDQILALCAHGAQHCWERLVWVCDVARLVQAHPALDWDVVFGRAQALRGGRVLALGLWLAHEQLGAELPQHVHQRIASDPALAHLAQRVMEGVFGFAETSWTPERKSRFHLGCRDRLIDRLRYLVLRVLNSRLRRPAGA